MYKFTTGTWSVPHFARDDVKCDCASVLAEGYMGAIAEVFFDNGKLVGEGGNDCPSIVEAKANAFLISAAPDLLRALQAITDLYETDEGCRNLPEYIHARDAINRALGK